MRRKYEARGVAKPFCSMIGEKQDEKKRAGIARSFLLLFNRLNSNEHLSRSE
jgi:hypothetical protein